MDRAMNKDERHHRKGSAVYGRGKERLKEILTVARELLAEEGYATFSMRGLASRIGVKLGAIQHYFPTLNDLHSAVWNDIVASYEESVSNVIKEKVLESPGATSEEKFRAAIDYLINDVKDPTTSKLFFELWSQAQRDEFMADVMAKIYSALIKQVKSQLVDINPHLAPRQRTLRAALIASQIEGLMILMAASRNNRIPLKGLEQEAQSQILHLATTP